MISALQGWCARLMCYTIAIILSSTAAIAAESDPLVYDQTKTAVMVTKAQPVFIIKLKSNPTTGYTWQLREYDKSLITPVRHQYVAPDSKLMGAPGFDLWTFKVKNNAFVVPHRTTIRLVYVRPWEENQNAAEAEFVVTTSDGGSGA